MREQDRAHLKIPNVVTTPTISSGNKRNPSYKPGVLAKVTFDRTHDTTGAEYIKSPQLTTERETPNAHMRNPPANNSKIQRIQRVVDFAPPQTRPNAQRLPILTQLNLIQIPQINRNTIRGVTGATELCVATAFDGKDAGVLPQDGDCGRDVGGGGGENEAGWSYVGLDGGEVLVFEEL